MKNVGKPVTSLSEKDYSSEDPPASPPQGGLYTIPEESTISMFIKENQHGTIGCDYNSNNCNNCSQYYALTTIGCNSVHIFCNVCRCWVLKHS